MVLVQLELLELIEAKSMSIYVTNQFMARTDNSNNQNNNNNDDNNRIHHVEDKDPIHDESIMKHDEIMHDTNHISNTTGDDDDGNNNNINDNSNNDYHSSTSSISHTKSIHSDGHDNNNGTTTTTTTNARPKRNLSATSDLTSSADIMTGHLSDLDHHPNHPNHPYHPLKENKRY